MLWEVAIILKATNVVYAAKVMNQNNKVQTPETINLNVQNLKNQKNITNFPSNDKWL
jgi:hypothetical protein